MESPCDKACSCLVVWAFGYLLFKISIIIIGGITVENGRKSGNVV